MLTLTEITQRGGLAAEQPLTDDLKQICEMTIAWYDRIGFHPPWVSYLAKLGGVAVGSCGFKGSPANGRVEIAYYTLPQYEGRGIATEQARQLVARAQREDASLCIAAQTLPAESASTSILKKLGFVNRGCVMHPEDGEVWEWQLPVPASGQTV